MHPESKEKISINASTKISLNNKIPLIASTISIQLLPPDVL
jgi:hypothetical protein